MTDDGFLRTVVGTAIAYLIVMGVWVLVKSVYITLERRSAARLPQAGRQERP